MKPDNVAPGLSRAFARRVLAALDGDPSTIMVAERVWIAKWRADRGGVGPGSDRMHGYRRLAGAKLIKLQGSQFGTGMQWKRTPAGERLLREG